MNLFSEAKAVNHIDLDGVTIFTTERTIAIDGEIEVSRFEHEGEIEQFVLRIPTLEIEATPAVAHLFDGRYIAASELLNTFIANSTSIDYV
ncbi:hypothetical protein [Rummeliibacillus pycnus]|uniref:hypothetical protein n=1 Tax=Rummeliibacillus pycnus TaxID=101070 RepID=UPI000C9B62E7|nr:hypothetical protein [Rummeliibacillus pycnus]